jgi:hypothetical protein
MRFESDRDRPSVFLLGSGHNLVEHPNVGAVYPVEISHADQRRPEVSRNFIELMKSLHSTSHVGQPLSAVSNSNCNLIPSYEKFSAFSAIFFANSAVKAFPT